VFVEGLAGQLIRDQALTISLSLLASLGVALTIVPILSASQPGAGAPAADAAPEAAATAAPGRPPGGRGAALVRGLVAAALFAPRALVRGAAWLGRRVSPVVNRLLTPFDRGYAALQRVYPGLLGAALARPGRVLGLSAGAFALSLLVATLLPINLFPVSSQGRFNFNVRLAEGTALEVTDSVLTRIAAAVSGDPRVHTVYTTAGQTDLSAFAGSAREANRGQIAVAMKRATDRRGEEAVAGRLREVMETVPGLGYEFEQPSLLTFRFPVEVEVYAYDLEKLRRASAAVVQRLALVPGLEDVQSSARAGEPEVQIQFDRDRLSAMHLEPESASRLVRNAVQGEAATQFSDLDRKLDVRVRATEGERDQVARLANLEVGRNNGEPVSLGAVAAVTVARGPGEIRRISQQRAAVVTANLAGRDLGSAARDIQAALGGLDLPEGARAVLAGQNQELQQSFGSLRFALLLAVFLVYLVMASQFESLLHPFIIMFTLPMAVIGVVATLVLTRTPVSVMVLIGFIILAGIVVSNGIVLVAYTNQLRHLGRSKLEALVEAGQVRMRPILLTALATILGLVPMALGFGEGAEIRAPLALTLIGGLSCATVLTLVVLPVMYAVLDRSR
jgi:HAE1 family hydrophobic/amphiphilic exporter-1